MKGVNKNSKKIVKENAEDREYTDKKDVSGIIKYGTNPRDLGKRTIKNSGELEKNITTNEINKKHRPYK